MVLAGNAVGGARPVQAAEGASRCIELQQRTFRCPKLGRRVADYLAVARARRTKDMKWLSMLFGSGRTSLRRGLIGMVAAPVIAVLLLPTPLFVISLVEHWPKGPITMDTITTGLTLLAIAFVIASIVAVFVGVPLWIVLRRLQRESGLAYVAGGAVGGWAVPMVISSLRGGLPTFDVLQTFIFAVRPGGRDRRARVLVDRKGAPGKLAAGFV
jgi:hypothetical protein